ncbi:hypothetical protein SBRCBS47491_006013 [Sporothrix bragantina]|uniref:Uncharacterized protein n=1 Tax=Sporothrix bragantina TaxID=671064 RepID=A0ABP0C1P4_9PEZI
MAAVTSAQMRFLTDAAHLMRQTAPRTSAHLMSRRIDLASTSQAAAVAAGTTPIAALPQTDIQRQHDCTSCGLILVPGSNGTTLTIQSGRPAQKNKRAKKPEPERKRKRDEIDGKTSEATIASEAPVKPPHTPVPHAGITKVYTCGLCSRETRIALPPPPPLPKQRKPKAVAGTQTEDETPAIASTLVNAAAKSPSAPATAPPATTVTTTTSTTTAKSANNANSKKRAKNRKAGLLALLDKSRATESSGMNLNFTFDDFRMK